MEIEINMNYRIILLLTICGNLWAAKDYINQYFPENSVIRKVHNEQPHGTDWFGFDNEARSACDHLNKLYDMIENRAHGDYSMWYVYVYDSIKHAVQTIVGNQDDQVFQNEFDWSWELKNHLDEKALERYYISTEYQHQLAREQKLKTIRACLSQKDSYIYF